MQMGYAKVLLGFLGCIFLVVLCMLGRSIYISHKKNIDKIKKFNSFSANVADLLGDILGMTIIATMINCIDPKKGFNVTEWLIVIISMFLYCWLKRYKEINKGMDKLHKKMVNNLEYNTCMYISYRLLESFSVCLLIIVVWMLAI